MANLCIVGLWHQGVVVSACFADLGYRVKGIGDNTSIVSGLNLSEPPVYEPKLNSILCRNLRVGQLEYTTDYTEGLREAEFAFISLDTPVGLDDKPELDSVYEAARRIAHNLAGNLVVVVTAQVPVGTCERIDAIIREENPDAVFDIAYVPEFLRLGEAVDTFRRADRFVVGANDSVVAERVAALYRPLGRPVVLTNLRTAEMAKHASNTFMSSSISFINEIADLCDEVGADAQKVAEIMKLDRRIGKYAFLSPGLGFAGGTLGRDVRALQELCRSKGLDTPMMDAIMEVNQTRHKLVVQRLQKIYDSLQGLKVGILGLTYKPGTSTLRRAIALDIIRDLVERGVSVKAFDPLACLDEVGDLPPFEFYPDPYDVAQDSDALVLVTEWKDVHNLDLDRLRSAMRRPVFIDTRNIYDPVEMQQKGYIYSGIGRGVAFKLPD